MGGVVNVRCITDGERCLNDAVSNGLRSECISELRSITGDTLDGKCTSGQTATFDGNRLRSYNLTLRAGQSLHFAGFDIRSASGGVGGITYVSYIKVHVICISGSASVCLEDV